MAAVVPRPVISLLSESHLVETFDCGDDARNAWLVRRALPNQVSGDARTYVATEGTTVLAFHAITVGSILRTTLNARLRRNAPEMVGCVLLAQLAVSIGRQGEGLGREMVLHAMRQAVRIADIGGSRLLATHPARPELTEYYVRFGFVSVTAAPALMVMPMGKVRAILGAPGL